MRIFDSPVKSCSFNITGSEPLNLHNICFNSIISSYLNSFFNSTVKIFVLSTGFTVSINIVGGSSSFLLLTLPEIITLCSDCNKSPYSAIFELKASASVFPVKSSIVINLIYFDGSLFCGICLVAVINPQTVTDLSFGISGI